MQLEVKRFPPRFSSKKFVFLFFFFNILCMASGKTPVMFFLKWVLWVLILYYKAKLMIASIQARLRFRDNYGELEEAAD